MKILKTAATIMFICFSTLIFALTASAEKCRAVCISGDTDADGYITVTDARAVLRVAIKLDSPVKDAGSIYDFDRSGTVDINDAREVLRCAINLETAPDHSRVGITGREPTCLEDGVSDKIYCDVCGRVLSMPEPLAKTQHRYISSVKEPTCSEGGYTLNICVFGCGSEYISDETPVLPHTWDSGTVIIPATCTEDGLTAYSCTVCDAGKDETEPATGHKRVTDKGVKPTCTEGGISDGAHCEYCGKVFSEQKTLPPAGHTESVTEGKEATCTAPGYTESSVCVVCGIRIKERYVVKAKGHTIVNDPYIIPTCTEKGLSGGKHCSVCGYVEIAQEELPPLGHKTVTDKGYAPSCTKEGRKDGTHCTVCGTVIIGQEVIPATGHTAQSVAEISPTCTANGVSAYEKCSVCKVNITEPEVLPALGHKRETVPGYKAGCLTTGKTDGVKCARCGIAIERAATILPLGHDYKDSPVKPTCTQSGYTLHTCSRCGETTKSEFVAKLGHAYVYSFNGSGTHKKSCSRCLTVFETGEKCNTDSVITPVTCTTDGYTDFTCRLCGGQYRGSVVRAKGHTAGAAKTENKINPTCTVNGSCEKAVYCTVCSKELSRNSEVIKAAGHKSVTDAYKAPGCVTTGLTEGSHCSVCGEVLLAQQEISETGHSWNEWQHGFDQNGTTYHSRECGVCGETEKAGCVMTAEIVKMPTETEDGEVRIFCPVCGYSYSVGTGKTGQ